MIYRYDGRPPPSIEFVSNANFGNASSGVISFSATMSFGAVGGNRHLALAAGFQAATTIPFTVTIGGVTATVVVQTENLSGSVRYISLIAIASVPTGTSGVVDITFDSGGGLIYAGYALHALRNIDSATPTDTGIDNGFSEASVSLDDSIAISEKGLVLATAFQRATVGGDTIGDASWTNATESVDQGYTNVSGLQSGQTSAIYTASAAEGSRTITVSNIRNRCSFCVAAFR